MAMKQLSKAVALAAMATSGAVMADTPKLSEVLDASGIAITGYVDAAYTHYNNDVPSPINYFDSDKDGFNLKQAAITIASQPKEGFGALVNITTGSDADCIRSYPYNKNSIYTDNGGSDCSVNGNGFDVTQAFVQYATGPFTAIAGKFNTLAGAEVIAPTGNTNISRSIAFLNALPFTHTGVRLSVAPIDTLTLYAGLNNGWDQQTDINNEKTVELGAVWNPVTMVSWAASIYNGKEPIVNPLTDEDTNTNRFLFDTVLTIKPTDSLAFIINYDYGKQEDAVLKNNLTDTKDAEWTALVGYANYQFTDEWRVSLRGEVFDDKQDAKIGLADLATGEASKKTKEWTLTVGYAPSKNFEVRGEVREDYADEDAFVKDDDSATDKQTFLALEALYKF
ncbi:MAG TPA: outer membrane beta-barrel protein [Spongiibacteraceae bacterium]|nr:outer membrane beta-barrel protein [Spongiibacteraceae bacterium]